MKLLLMALSMEAALVSWHALTGSAGALRLAGILAFIWLGVGFLEINERLGRPRGAPHVRP